MPGKPARFAGTVNTSFRYIVIGSETSAPKGKAGDGVVGVKIASTSLNALSKSSFIRRLTCCALR